MRRNYKATDTDRQTHDEREIEAVKWQHQIWQALRPVRDGVRGAASEGHVLGPAKHPGRVTDPRESQGPEKVGRPSGDRRDGI